MKTRLLTLLAAMLMLTATAASTQAKVLYAELSADNKTMTLKCADAAPDGTKKYTGSYFWSSSFCSSVTTVIIEKSCEEYDGTTLKDLFNGFDNLADISGLGYLNKTGTVTSMCRMFQICQELTSLDLSKLNTEGVMDMSFMFYSCRRLNAINFGSSFNTARVKDMSYMFSECSALTSLDLSAFNTGKVTNMANMFDNCYRLPSIKGLSTFNTEQVTDMSSMFVGCRALTTLDLSAFNTEQVKNMRYMFQSCTGLVSLDLSTFNTGEVTNMYGMFNGCEKLTTLNLGVSFSTASVTDMGYMFNNCESLASLDLSAFNTGEVTNMVRMFAGCNKLNSLDISTFNTASVTNMSYMFNGCNELQWLDLGSFNTAKVTNVSYMFNGCNKLETILVGSGWDVSKASTYNNMFYNCNKIVGEYGTTYSLSYISNTKGHARDGGYLTLKTATVSTSAAEIDGYHWATYYKSTVNRQVDDLSATTVYTATRNGNELTLVPVLDGIIKAGQGVILKSTATSIGLTTVATAATDTYYDDNALSGVDKATSQTAGTTYYVLSYENEKLGFYKYAADNTLGAHKAFIADATGSAPAMFSFGTGDDDTTTAVSGMANGELRMADGAVYDLQGRKVSEFGIQNPELPRGIYVTSGKKVVIK